MNRPIPILTIIAIVLAGCASPSPAPDEATQDAAAPPPEPLRFTGVSQASEMAVCTTQELGCFGYWSVEFEDRFNVPGDASNVTIQAEWDAVVPVLERLDVFVFVGDYFQGHRVLARGQGTSPLTFELERDAIERFSGPYHVGFQGSGPASVRWEQQIGWTATVHVP